MPSAETRYGAFRALWAMNERDPQLRGEHLPTNSGCTKFPAPARRWFTSRTASGRKSCCSAKAKNSQLPIAAGSRQSIIVKSQPDGQISVARFSLQHADQRRTVENSVAEVIRAIAAVGGDYPDAVQALQQAQAGGALASRFEVDAIPEWGRVYDRNRTLVADNTGPSRR